MAETPSTMALPLGAPAPAFALPDPRTGRTTTWASVRGESATVVAFVCNHCPFVIHVAPEFGRLAGQYRDRGVGFVAISSNDVEKYPQDAPEAMATFAAESGWDFPYLYDVTQGVAKAYAAACTPDFYVFDRGGFLAYLGQLDGARPKNGKPVTGSDLRAALDAVLAGEAAPQPQIPSTGCNIKWKPGMEPPYYGQ